MLLAEQELQRQRTTSAERRCEQHRGPRAERDGGPQKRRQQFRVLADGRKERKTDEAEGKGERHNEHAAG